MVLRELLSLPGKGPGDSAHEQVQGLEPRCRCDPLPEKDLQGPVRQGGLSVTGPLGRAVLGKKVPGRELPTMAARLC